MMTRRLLLSSVAATAAIFATTPTKAGQWPQRPIRMIVPFPPGGLTDGIARLIGQRLSESLGQPFLVENIGGAAGAIAAKAVAQAPADGYTILMATLPQIAILPALGHVPYDPMKDFTPISNIASAPFVLMVNKNIPASNLKEFVDYVRVHPGQITYASSGIGSLAHLSMAIFLKRAGIDMIHVPYRGGAPAVSDLAGGHVAAYFGTRTDAVQQVQTGAIRLLAVSDDKRSTQIPDVPTVIESGYPGFRIVAWNGLMAPALTAEAIIGRLATEVRRATKSEAFVQNLANIGADSIGDSPHEFAADIAVDVPLWAEAVRISGAKLQ
jgi:tripartite-type tricarboxylate transporter receptor subunit TctC